MARVGEPRLLQAVTAVHGVKSGPARAAKLRERGVAPTQTSPALVARPRRGLFPHDVRRRRRDVLAYRDRGRCRHAARLTRDVGTRRLWASGVALYSLAIDAADAVSRESLLAKGDRNPLIADEPPSTRPREPQLALGRNAVAANAAPDDDATGLC